MSEPRRFLVAAQLSSLFPPSQITSIHLRTARRSTPLPPFPKESDPPVEHAVQSSVLHTPTTGTVILRLLHGGLVLELVSLTTKVNPIRFVFPAAILPSPALFLWQGSELHVLAVTTMGSVYRLVLPVGTSGDLWQDPTGVNWCREYIMKSVIGPMKGLVHVQGPHCVVIGMPSGSIMRIETEFLGDESRDDEWTESVLQHGSFLSSLTAFLPNLHPTPAGGSEIISMATHPQPTDISYVWTLSRDRTIRLWTAKAGCVSEKTLPILLSGRAGTPASLSPSHTFLDAERQILLRTFSMRSTSEDLYLLAFIPTPTSTTSGGFFQLFKTEDDQLYEMGRIESSKISALSRLQDFLIAGDLLFILWDRQGQSMVERADLGPDQLAGLNDVTWEVMSYMQEPDLTPSDLDDLLLSPGSLTDTIFEAIMRPGMFSALTLRTAIEQYTDACLSLPGPPPPQLRTTYATVGENIAAVVGCTVNLIRDPHTGALQHAKYWNALKRDWEGFIARCREVERSARWPLSLGYDEPDGKVFVVERERIGLVVEEDLALQFRRLLNDSTPMDASYTLLDVVWTLRTQLGRQAMAKLEYQIFELTHQEIGFSMADLLQDEAEQSKVIDDLDDGMQDWILGRLRSIPHLDTAIRTVLDVIGGLDKAVKQEEEEVADEIALNIPPPQSDCSRALTAAYIAATVQARYDLCLALLLVLFFLSAELQDWSPALLAEIFAVFRGIAMLRSIVRRPACNPKVADDSTPADDVIARMGNMQVSQNRTRYTPHYALIHRLLPELSFFSRNVASVAHQYLDAGGLLRSTSPAHATDYEVKFCNTLRDQGYHDMAQDMLAWLPRTPAVTYVLARLWLDVGQPDDAAYLLEKLAARAGPESGLWPDDRQALEPVLSPQDNDCEFAFYCHVAELFKASSTHHEVMFAQLALSVAPHDTDTTGLWTSMITGNIALGLYDDAYTALTVCPHEKLKREYVSHLVYRMCEEDAVEKLLSYNFNGFADEVEDALSFKARNVDPRGRPFYSRILYSWFISRGNYRNAALTMYQRARKLNELMNDPSVLVTLAEEQLEAYLVAMNALALLDRKSAWVSMPTSTRTGQETQKRRKLSKHIPEARYSHSTYDSEVVDLADMQYEYTLLSARLDLVRRQSPLLSGGEFSLPPPSIVLRLVQSSHFDMALATARSLGVDMSDLFAHLTGKCLRLSHDPDSVIQEDTSDWLLTDSVTSWAGTPADRGWRYLRQSLHRHDSAETDYKYTKVTLETILTFDKASLPPPWLIQILEEHHPEYLIRTSLRYENFESALEETLLLVRKTDEHLARDPTNYASSTWLPYTLIDQVIIATSQPDSSPAVKTLRQQLEKEIDGHVKRVQKLSQFTL